MAGPANDSSYLPVLREMWPQKSIEFCLYEEDPFLGSVRKDATFTEIVRHVATGYSSGGGGVSTKFATAKQYKSSSKTRQFSVSTVSYYAVLSLDGRLARRAKHGGDKSVIIDPLKTESTMKMEEARRRIGRDLYRNGGGALGQISTAGSSPAASNTITLTKAADIRNFEIDMPIQLSATDGTTGTVRSGVCVITGISDDESAPTITVSGTTFADNITAPGTADFIFPVDAFTNVIWGMDSWCPTWTVGSPPPAFLGVTRSDFPARLAGRVVNGATLGITSKLGLIQRAARIAKDAGSKPDQVLISTRNWESLANELQSGGKLIYSAVPAQGVNKFKPGLEYKSIQVMGAGGLLDVMACPDMPDDHGRVIQSKDWYLGSCGPLLSWVEDAKPGGGMVEEMADASEYRLVGDMNLICENPGRQVKFLF